tara:strand:- start:197 stop:415 length:219 start_codon:yes stop_codon:yes gene_type:complete
MCSWYCNIAAVVAYLTVRVDVDCDNVVVVAVANAADGWDDARTFVVGAVVLFDVVVAAHFGLGVAGADNEKP